MYKYRTLEPLVLDSLKAFRVVSVTGARQVGKTTLVKRICGRRGLRYVSLEDPVARAAALADPDAWLAGFDGPLAIDEIQHVPDLFRAIKRRVDEWTRPGQYLITGSALWLSMGRIGETLAGRVAVLELWPFSHAEWMGNQPFDFGELGAARLNVNALQASLEKRHASGGEWLGEAVLRGGFPVPSGIRNARQRRLWYESYISTYLQRDVLDMVRIEHPAAFTRLLRLLAARSGQVVNISSLARDLGIPQPTARRYVHWLQTTYQCSEWQPYSANLGKRLVKNPKLYWNDSGMMAVMLGCGNWQDVERAQLAGQLAETWVAGEILKWRSIAGTGPLCFWRTHSGGEVDFLIELEGRITAVEVKLGRRIDQRDLRGLKECRDLLGGNFRRGVVFYGGNEVLPVAPDLIAVPLAVLKGTRIPA